MNTFKFTTRTNRILAWGLVALVACLIFYMSAKTGEQLDHNSGFLSTVKAWLAQCVAELFGHPVDVSPIGHFTEYFVFGAALFNALRLHFSIPHCAWAAIALASAYGITDEIHQIFVPTRTCDPMDWIVDTCAAACAVGLILLIRTLKNRQSKVQ